MSAVAAVKSSLSELDRSINSTEFLLSTHRAHPYPGRFLPQIAESIILQLSSPGEIVFDPMAGSGTVLEVAARSGRVPIGSDVNPVAALIASFASPISEQVLSEAAQSVTQIKEALNRSAAAGTPLPARKAFHNWHLWYRPEVLKELCYVSAQISSLERPQVRRVLKLALSRTARVVSNADPRDMYPQRCKDMPVRPRLNVADEFQRSFDKITQAAEIGLCNDPNRAFILRSDARSVPLRDESVDLIVTSPPYGRAIEYVRVHQLSMNVIGFHRTDLKFLHSLDIGSDRASAGEDSYIDCLLAAIGEGCRVLRVGGHIAFVAADAVVSGKEVMVCDLIVTTLQRSGFTVLLDHRRKYFKRSLTPKRRTGSTPIEEERVIVARKNKSLE